MKEKLSLLLVTFIIIVFANAQSTNIVIYRIGDGRMPLTNAVPVFLDNHSVSFSGILSGNAPLVQSIPLPSTTGSASIGNYLLSASVNSIEGQITRSADGNYLVFTGYDVGTDTSTTMPSALYNSARVIGTIDQAGIINTSTAISGAPFTNAPKRLSYSPRAVVSPDGHTFFFNSSTTGIFTATVGASTATKISSYNSTTSPNGSPVARSIEIYNDTLYTSYQTTYRPKGIGTAFQDLTMASIGSINNIPADTAITPLTGIDTISNSWATYNTGTVKRASPYQFVILKLKKGTVLYIADDNTSDSLTERGILKYSLVNGTWNYNGSIYAYQCRGLTATNSGDSVILFGTSPNFLYGAMDIAGFNAPPSGIMPKNSAVILQSAAPNTLYRGVAFGAGVTVNAIFNAPGIVSFTPTIASKGDTITIRGNKFTGTISVTFGDSAAAFFKVVSDTVIKAIVGSGGSGSATVNVITNHGTASLQGFTYVGIPIITSFFPKAGINGSTITIHGHAFTNASKVSFGGDSAKAYTVINDSTINAVVGKGASGSVVVSTRYGKAILQGFSYCQPSFDTLTKVVSNLYTWHGKTYNQSGFYTFDTLNAIGCDSMVTLNLTIYNPWPIITASGVNPLVGDSIIFVRSGMYDNVTVKTPASSGQGLLWDYSYLNNANYPSGNKIHKSNGLFSSGIPLNLPDGNVITYTAYNSEYFTNLDNITDSSWSYAGSYQSPCCNYSNNGYKDSLFKPLHHLIYPTTYGTHFSDSTTSQETNYGKYNIASIHDTVNCDAYGTLILPNATYRNVLLIKHTMKRVNSNNYFTSMNPMEVEYLFMVNGIHSPVLKLYQWYANTWAAEYFVRDSIPYVPTLDTAGVSPVITASGYNPVIGDAYKMQNANASSTTPFFEAGGRDLYWDFSNMIKDTISRVNQYVDFNSLPVNTSLYPKANIASVSNFSKTNFSFYQVSNNSYNYVGYFDSLDGGGHYYSPEDYSTLVSYPMTYKKVVNTQAANGFYDSVHKSFTSNGGWLMTITADAFGTLKLPDGKVYNNVLRLKTTSTEYFNYNNKLFYYDTSYQFITNGIHTPLLTLSRRGTGWYTQYYNGIYTPPLSVAITNIHATNQNGLVALNWQTTNELNNSYFTIQHSTDCISFSDIGNVKAKGSVSNSYTFTDKKPTLGINYYRLMSFDKEGKVTYSKVVSVSLNNYQLSIVPNPAKNFATINFNKTEDKVTIAVYDITGKAVITQSPSGSANSYKLNTQSLTNGVYLLKVNTATGSYNEKLLINK